MRPESGQGLAAAIIAFKRLKIGFISQHGFLTQSGHYPAPAGFGGLQQFLVAQVQMVKGAGDGDKIKNHNV